MTGYVEPKTTTLEQIDGEDGEATLIHRFEGYPDCVGIQWIEDANAMRITNEWGNTEYICGGWGVSFTRTEWERLKQAMDRAFGAVSP